MRNLNDKLKVSNAVIHSTRSMSYRSPPLINKFNARLLEEAVMSFRDIAFDRSKITILGYPLAFNPPPPPTEGSPGTTSVKFYLVLTDG